MGLKRSLPAILLGFMALSFQVILLREFSVHFYGNEVTFGLLLAAWLLWGGLGSLISPRLRYAPRLMGLTYYLALIIFPLCLAGLRFSRFFWGALPGEITGLLPAFFSAMALAFLASFPLGVLFVFNAHHLGGEPAKAYFLESLGSALACFFVYFFLIPRFSNWQAAAIVSGIGAFAIPFLFDQKHHKLLTLVVLLLVSGLFASDLISQKLYWKPYHLVQTRDSPYGKLQLLKSQEQLSLYDNSLLVYSSPDLSSAEESVHFGLLQHPEAEEVLLIGGGAGGSLAQALKYPKVKIDYVELDPEIIRISLRHLPDKERLALLNPRVQIFFLDGRAFLNHAHKKYDAIILNLPEPATAQINRFYTLEFFLLAREKLKEQGIFSFRVPSAENYISQELQDFLASLYFTLKQVFPAVAVVPGDSSIFLASSRLEPLDYRDLIQRIEQFGLANTYVSPQVLASRLAPLRVDLLQEKVSSGKNVLNLDFAPISYFFNSVLWSKHFRGLEALALRFFSGIGKFWLLDFPLFIFILLLFVLAAGKIRSAFFLTPLAVMGLTTITVEIIAIIGFQVLFGYFYQKISFFFGCFMVGLFLGSFCSRLRKNTRYLHLLALQAGFIILLLLAKTGLKARPPEVLFYIFLLGLGYFSGDLFVVSNQLFLRLKKNYGLGYALDLFGSFLGALAASSLLIPLAGLPLLLHYLLLLNSFCLLFLIWGFKSLRIA